MKSAARPMPPAQASSSPSLRRNGAPSPKDSSGRLRGDGGAALVEAAIISPVFLFLLFGVFEMGILFRNTLALSNAVTRAARAASTFGDAVDADAQIIGAVKQSSSAFPQATIEKVVVFNATLAAQNQGVKPPQADVPPACLTGGPGDFDSNQCNVYTPWPHFLFSDSSMFNDNTEAECADNDKPAEYWCPMSRKVALEDPPDYLGVYIEIEHKWTTGLFGEGFTLSQTRVVRLEPKELRST